MALLSARSVAKALGVRQPGTVLGWAKSGVIPFVAYGKQRRFIMAEVRAAMLANQRRSTMTCPKCGAEFPLDQAITRPDPRCKGQVTLAHCRGCHLAYKQQQRRRRAEQQGRSFRTRDEMASDRAERLSARAAAAEARRSRPKQTHAEMIARMVKRQRIRYATDPDYQAQVKAKKIKRKRAMAAALVEPVNRELVAERDRWRCGICGKRVTRKTWSLDHIVPLSKGGDHSYRNVTLAHRKCNSARGAGRLAVQVPLLTQSSLTAGTP